MADNVAITAGSGTTIAADDIGGVLHQRVKISQGADGAATDVSSAAPLNVTLANTGANATPVTVNGTVAATQSGTWNVNNVSGTVSLPTGAATAAKQPALGTAGTPSSDVITVQGVTSMTPLKVDGSAVTQPVSGTVAVSTINSVAPAFGSGVRGATVQRVTIATDDVVPASQSGTWILGANSGVDIGDVTINNASGGSAVNIQDGGNSITVDGTVTASNTAGDVAHDSADSGNPVKIGGKAVSSEPTAVANADRANLITDLVGKLITLPYANPENFVSGAITTSMTGTTSTSLVAAPGAGLRNYITTIIVSNAHATVGTDIVIQDGSGGTTLLTIPAAAVYGGAVINLPVPLRQPTTNTAIYCANVTTGASTKASAVGYKGA